MQVEGIFEIPPSERSDVAFDVDLPIEDRDWHIGLIAGPSGSGKTLVAREFFAPFLVTPFKWPYDASVLDVFPNDLGIKEITELISSVGFSTPMSWLRPFHVLSNGEQFRVMIAHALSERRDITVVDEFTSVVDRVVAKACSAAVARVVRRRKQRFIAVSCHYDVVDWLDPDWIYEPHLNRFVWRSLRGQPDIRLRVFCVDKEAWRLFRHAHYLDTNLHKAARCFCAFWDDVPVAFVAVLPFPHPVRPGWRMHRLVCLPDYQGLGIGVKLSDYVCSLYKATGKPVRRTLAHPAVIRHCLKSPVWRTIDAPVLHGRHGGGTGQARMSATTRLTASFEYVGPARVEQARRFGLRFDR